MKDLVLPAFKMDCRDWLVVTPEEAGLPEEIAGAPLLAVLSTVVLDADTFAPASGVLTVGLLDEDVPTGRILAPGCVAQKLDDDGDGGVGGCVRYMLPAPDHRLALLAEFNLAEAHETELLPRIDVLMASFRWAE